MQELLKLVDENYLLSIKNAEAQIAYYQAGKRSKRTWSKAIRFASILLFGLAGIFPLLRSFTFYTYEVKISDWGYVSIALAGTLLLLDKFFGFSSAWMRYITTEMDIQKLKKDFEAKWKVENIKIPDRENLSADQAVALLQMTRDFVSQIDELVKQETLSWATEFQSNVSELQKMTNSKLETMKPGSIRVVIKEAQLYKDFVIHIDGFEKRKSGTAEMLLDHVSPGPHEITVLCKTKDNLPLSKSTVLEVEANKMSVVEIAM